jgi:hypoxanthine phosphoribosyltransferase
MSYLSKYKKKDFKRVSWDECVQNWQGLGKKISGYLKKNNVKIDAVVPILRGGSLPGGFLAYQLGILKVIPVQYKYFFVGDKAELRSILPLQTANLPKNSTLLLVEGNHCFGVTAANAAKDIKELLPQAKILYAADHMDYSYQKNDYADAIFYGLLTNDCLVLTPDQAKKKGIYPYSYIMPWEVMKEEWETVNAKQYKYADVKEGDTASYDLKTAIDL